MALEHHFHRQHPFNSISILDQPIEAEPSETVVVDEGVGARGDDMEPHLMRFGYGG